MFQRKEETREEGKFVKVSSVGKIYSGLEYNIEKFLILNYCTKAVFYQSTQHADNVSIIRRFLCSNT